MKNLIWWIQEYFILFQEMQIKKRNKKMSKTIDEIVSNIIKG